jgi:hypothetical protein
LEEPHVREQVLNADRDPEADEAPTDDPPPPIRRGGDLSALCPAL